MRVSNFIAIIFLLFPLHIIAQENQDPVIPDTPPSPQAVAFNRLGEYQVNNNYGAPDINIPLWEIDFHGYKIPLTLHYEAKPLKPGYNYDVTGLGWTLSGNSCVSRTIKDRADEIPGRYNTPSFTLDSFDKKYKDEAGTLHELNFQFDSYNIVLPSGRSIPFFMYVENGGNKNELKVKPLTISLVDSNIKIICNYSNRNHQNASIDSFDVTDENGITYHFTVADKTTNSYTNALNADRNVAWLLTRIDIPGKGSIEYCYNERVKIHTYDPVPEPVVRVHRMTYLDNEIEYRGNTGVPDAPERFTVTKTLQEQCPEYEMRFLASIRYGSTVVNFKYADDKMHMNEIVVSDYNNSTKKYDIIRKFTLNINGRSQLSSFLNSIVISGQNKIDQLVYSFDYNSFSPGNYTDYWGNRCYSNNYKDVGNFNMFLGIKEDGYYLPREYFHNQLDNKKFAILCNKKETDPYYYYKIKLQSTLYGDTRKPAQPEEHGVLTKIIYPNGGYTEFCWENHRFLTATAEDGDFVYDRRRQRIIEGGGFRIKSIINYTADKEIGSQDHYRYGYTYGEIKKMNFPLPLPGQYDPNKHIGCGEAVVDPNILTFMDFNYFNYGVDSKRSDNEFIGMILGFDTSFKNMVLESGAPKWWDADFSAYTFRALLGNRKPVVYPEITVYHGNPEIANSCISKTVYKYDIYDYKMTPMKYYLTTIYQSGKDAKDMQLDTAYFEPIRYMGGSKMVCDEIPYKRHLMKSMSDYSYDGKTWNLISKEENEYQDWNEIQKMGYEFNSSISRIKYYHNDYGNVDTNPWSEECKIGVFYKQVWQKLSIPAKLTKKTTTILRQGGTRDWNNTQTESYRYLYSGVMKSKTYTDGYDKEDVNSYIGETDNNDPVIKEMKKRNMLASLVKTKTISNAWPHIIDDPNKLLVTGYKIDYGFYGNNIFPSILYEGNVNAKQNGSGEEDGIVNYEASVKVLSYDSIGGNPTEIEDLKTGTRNVYIWSSDGRYMIAMIKNATLPYDKIIASLREKEATLTSRTRYDMLQKILPKSLIETWDYKPLIGVSSHTDISGKTTLYEYDGLGRLIAEKRVVNGKTTPEVIHEYEYNYKNQ